MKIEVLLHHPVLIKKYHNGKISNTASEENSTCALAEFKEWRKRLARIVKEEKFESEHTLFE